MCLHYLWEEEKQKNKGDVIALAIKYKKKKDHRCFAINGINIINSGVINPKGSMFLRPPLPSLFAPSHALFHPPLNFAPLSPHLSIFGYLSPGICTAAFNFIKNLFLNKNKIYHKCTGCVSSKYYPARIPNSYFYSNLCFYSLQIRNLSL